MGICANAGAESASAQQAIADPRAGRSVGRSVPYLVKVMEHTVPRLERASRTRVRRGSLGTSTLDRTPSRHSSGRDPVPPKKVGAACAAHVPDSRLIRCVVLPYEIRRTIAVEIVRADEGPPRHAARRQPGPAAQHVALAAAHIPDRDLPSRVVLPDEIRLAVLIEVLHCGDPPS